MHFPLKILYSPPTFPDEALNAVIEVGPKDRRAPVWFKYSVIISIASTACCCAPNSADENELAAFWRTGAAASAKFEIFLKG